jgi:hypothetical protein
MFRQIRLFDRRLKSEILKWQKGLTIRSRARVKGWKSRNDQSEFYRYAKKIKRSCA